MFVLQHWKKSVLSEPGAMDHKLKNRDTYIIINIYPQASFFKVVDQLDLQEFLPQEQRYLTTEQEV